MFSARRLTSALALGALLSGALAAPALAAPPPLTMEIMVGDYCVGGTAKPDTVIKYTIKDASGALKGKDALLADSDGTFGACVDFFSDAIATGDRIKIVDYDTNEKLNYTVPRITLAVDRVTDVVTGKAPAGTKLELEASDFTPTLFGGEPYDVTKHLTASGAGTYSHDFGDDGIDLMGGAQIDVRAIAAGGRITVGRLMVVPALAVIVGQSTFVGFYTPFRDLAITIKVNGDTVATGDAVPTDISEFRSKFIDADGEPYKLVGGEQLSAPALGIAWTVPAINGTVDKAADKVSGKCFANSPYIVLTGFTGTFAGVTGESGAFTADLSDQTDIRKGDEVLIACATGAGDYVEQDIIVK